MVRVGVAASDPLAVIATPVATLPRDEAGGADLARVAELVRDRAAVEVVVGLPLTLRGQEGPSALMAREWAGALRRLVAVPVRLVDERLTTVQAERGLRESGVRTRDQRKIVDQAAAVAILQSALDSLGDRSGSAPGADVRDGAP